MKRRGTSAIPDFYVQLKEAVDIDNDSQSFISSPMS